MSGAGEAETALLEALCQAAEAEWTGRLREGMAAEDCGTAFPCAAAFTAAANLAAGRGGGGAVASFKAGDVSVEGRGGADGAALAEALRNTAERLMAPLHPGGGFCFQEGAGDDDRLGAAGAGTGMVRWSPLRHEGTETAIRAFLQPGNEQGEQVPDTAHGSGLDGRTAVAVPGAGAPGDGGHADVEGHDLSGAQLPALLHR